MRRIPVEGAEVSGGRAIPHGVVTRPDERDGSPIRVWIVRLANERPCARAASLLTPDEIARALQQREVADQWRFTWTRAALRVALSRVVDVPAPDLHFDTACRYCGLPHGKPKLRAARLVDFSVSHTEGVALIAISETSEVGVDVERATHQVPREGVFAQPELAELADIQPGDRSRARLRCWTRKEALLKGNGMGLIVDPSSFSVAPLTSPLVVVDHPHPSTGPSSVQRWTVADIDVGDDHIASVAVNAMDVKFDVRRDSVEAMFGAVGVHRRDA